MHDASVSQPVRISDHLGLLLVVMVDRLKSRYIFQQRSITCVTCVVCNTTCMAIFMKLQHAVLFHRRSLKKISKVKLLLMTKNSLHIRTIVDKTSKLGLIPMLW